MHLDTFWEFKTWALEVFHAYFQNICTQAPTANSHKKRNINKPRRAGACLLVGLGMRGHALECSENPRKASEAENRAGKTTSECHPAGVGGCISICLSIYLSIYMYIDTCTHTLHIHTHTHTHPPSTYKYRRSCAGYADMGRKRSESRGGIAWLTHDRCRCRCPEPRASSARRNSRPRPQLIDIPLSSQLRAFGFLSSLIQVLKTAKTSATVIPTLPSALVA